MELTDLRPISINGEINYNHPSLTNTDGSSANNKVVSFKVNDSTVSGASESYEVFSFTGERDGGQAGNFVINTYLDVKNSIFCKIVNASSINATESIKSNISIEATTYLSTGTGTIKFHDSENNDTRDFIYDGNGRQADSKSFGGGLFIENPDNSVSAVLTSNNFDTILNDKYLQLDIDGQGNTIEYNDSNPTINGDDIGGSWYFGADGDISDGGFQVKLLNTLGHTNSVDGYYIGSLDLTDETGTVNTNQVINGSGDWVGNTIDNNKLTENYIKNQSGDTAHRPSNPSVGDMYLDTQIDLPIWFLDKPGRRWIDAAGNSVD